MDALTAVAMVVFTVAAVVVFEDDEVETTEVVIFTAETDVLVPVAETVAFDVVVVPATGLSEAEATSGGAIGLARGMAGTDTVEDSCELASSA